MFWVSRTTVNFPRRNPACSLGSIGSINGSTQGVDNPLQDLVRDTEQRYRSIILLVPTGFAGFGITITSALLQILGILSRHKQEERKSLNQDFKAAPAWSINSEQMESGPGVLPGFKCWMAAVNSLR